MKTQLREDETIAGVTSALNSNSMLIAVSVNKFGIRRKVKADGATINGGEVGTDIAERSVTVTKKLLKCEEYDAIVKADNAFYTKMMARVIHSHYRKGVYLLPTKLFKWFLDEVNKYIDERDRLVDLFINAYRDRIREAIQDLGPLFNPGDYPMPDEVRKAFAVTWQSMARESVDERLKLFSPSEYQKQVTELQKSREEACEEVRRTLRAGLMQLVEHLAERLEPDADGALKVLRGSTVDNLSKWLDLFDDRNITNDQDLQDTVKVLRDTMDGVDRDILKDSDSVREAMLKTLDFSANMLGDMIDKKPRRQFDFSV